LEKAEELLKRLRKPLSYLAEDRGRYAYLDGSWTDLDDVVSQRWNPDKALPFLRERLAEIECCLSLEDPSDQLALDLYREGQGIRHAIGVLTGGSVANLPNEERKKDVRRWIDYSRRIS